MHMWGQRRSAAAERLVLPLDLGMRASQMDADLMVDLGGDLTAGSVVGLTEDSVVDLGSAVDSDAGVAALVLAGDGAGDGIPGGGEAGDRRGGDGAILPTRTGE